jgi:hypothetical protein
LIGAACEPKISVAVVLGYAAFVNQWIGSSLIRELSDGGRTLGVDVLDHPVVASSGFVSFKQRGWM